MGDWGWKKGEREVRDGDWIAEVGGRQVNRTGENGGRVLVLGGLGGRGGCELRMGRIGAWIDFWAVRCRL